MNGERIAQLRLANPFRPFTLVTDDGRRLSVGKPYLLAISRNRVNIVYESPDGDQLLLKVAAIASVEEDDGAGLSHRGVTA